MDITINSKRGLHIYGMWIECETKRQTDGAARVRVKTQITIPANSEIIIVGKVENSEFLSTRYSLTEPVIEDGRKRMLARTLVDHCGNRKHERVIYLDEHSVRLKRTYFAKRNTPSNGHN